MTEGSKQAPSWSSLGDRIVWLAKNKSPVSQTEFPDQDIPDQKIEEFPEQTLMEAVDSIDSVPRRPMQHRFDSAFNTAPLKSKISGSFLTAASTIGMMGIHTDTVLEGVEDPGLLSLAYGTGAALTAAGVAGRNSDRRLEAGEYGDRVYNDSADLTGEKLRDRRESVRGLLYSSNDVAVSFLDDTLDSYRDRLDLTKGGLFVDFLQQEADHSENIDLWLSKDEEDPLWTLHVQGTYEDGEDYELVATGFNPDYEEEEIEPESYEEIIEELSDDNYRDFIVQEDTEEIEKELRG